MTTTEWTPTIFVVEDDETISMGLVAALEQSGYRVKAFDRGEPAVAAAVDSPPDLVVLDIMLPGINGIEVLRRLKARNDELPVVLLTAKGAEAERVEGLDAGADDYVTKPFSLKELLARVRARLRSKSSPAVPDVYSFGEVSVDLRRVPVDMEATRAVLVASDNPLCRAILAHMPCTDG